MRLSRKQTLIILTTIILATILVFIPHLKNPFPLHIDEWNHITQSIHLKQGTYNLSIKSSEVGFHAILAIISSLTNLITFYKFLPSIWIVISSLTLFLIVKYKTKNLKQSFLLSLFSMIFFISIKSNVNISGLWFFTPLTFAIPFIYLFIFFFTEGIEKQNSRFLTYSLAIMIFLLFTHSISVLFSIPLLLAYSLINYKKAIKQKNTLLLFLLIPIIGLTFLKFILNLSFLALLKTILPLLLFKKGWGVLEINNSPLELYSSIGYILAIIGFISILSLKKHRKEFSIFLIWPLILLAQILFFKLTNFSPLSPYQRNLYYLAISLPFLSSFGLYHILRIIRKPIENKKLRKTILITLIIITIFLTFNSYYKIPKQLDLYQNINQETYQALVFLSTLEPRIVITPPLISPTVFPISKHQPISTLFFYGNRDTLHKFYSQNSDCNIKNKIIKENSISYVLSESPINCNWKVIYEKDNNWIYKTHLDKI